jgi:hypothetical protein
MSVVMAYVVAGAWIGASTRPPVRRVPRKAPGSPSRQHGPLGSNDVVMLQANPFGQQQVAPRSAPAACRRRVWWRLAVVPSLPVRHHETWRPSFCRLDGGSPRSRH